MDDQRFTGIWFDIQAKRRCVREDRRGWRKPLALVPTPNLRTPGRVDLAVFFCTGGRKHTYYHRIVALTLLHCHWTARGTLLARPYKIPVDRWGKDRRGRYIYEVHHRVTPFNQHPCALCVLPRRLHEKVSLQGFVLPEPRSGWGS